jgi:malonate transporter
VLASIVPVILLILLGVAIRRAHWMPDDFFPSLEKFSYYIAFPALLFTGIAKLDFHGRLVGELALATLLPTLIVAGLALLVLLFWRGLPDASRSSVVQGAMRPNSYFGIAVSALFFPQQTAALVMLALALCLPVVNMLSVLALSWWSGRKADMATVAKTLATNPIILSTLAGIAASLLGLALPAPLLNTLDILAKSALALGLVCVGSGLVFSLDGLRPAALALASFLKLLVLPVVASRICAAFGVSEPIALAACFYCALPTAPNAYIMARQLGGDARLMASMITLQTLLAAATIPLSRVLS